MMQDDRIEAVREAILASSVKYEPMERGGLLVTVVPLDAAMTIIDVLDVKGWLTKLEP